MVEALKSVEIFQRFTLKLLNSDKHCRKFQKRAKFHESFRVSRAQNEKTRVSIYIGYIGGSGGEKPPAARKTSIIFSNTQL